MSRVQDLWHRKDRTRTSKYGKGNRWRAIRTDGSGREQTRTFPTKDAATAWAHGTDSDHPGGALTVAEWAEIWQARQVHQRQSSRDAIRYKVRGQIVPALGHLRLDSVTRGDVQAAVMSWQLRGLAPSTVEVAYRYLAGMMREAVLDGLIPATPCVKIRLPRADEHTVDVLTVQQVQTIADHIAPWARYAVVLAAATGLRPGEWRGLTADRVDLKAGTILVDRQAGDTGTQWAPLKTPWSRRTIAVGPATLELLEALVAQAGPLGHLFHADKVGWKRTRISDAWSACRDDGRPWMGRGFHALRHHHASQLLSSGASVVAVARRLGHKDATETLRTYAHVMPSDDTTLAGMTDGLIS